METWKGERFELRLPGSGWTYLGDEDGKDGVRYETRKFENGEAVFALFPERAGSYLLRFQRQDPVSLGTASALVALTVKEQDAASSGSASSAAATGAAAVTAAPGAAAVTAVPGAAAVTAIPGAASTGAATTTPATGAASSVIAAPGAATTAEASPASPQAAADLASISAPEALLTYARDELGASRVRSAIDALDKYISLYPYGNDELFFLYGLAYEQDTPFRNIKRAYEYYKRVRDDYPRSKRWREAADRIAYLERHYFGLR